MQNCAYFKFSLNPEIRWYYWFLPQQFLYFFQLPHEFETQVFIVLFVFIILLVFQYLSDFIKINIICIICTNLYYKYLYSVDKMWTLSTSVHCEHYIIPIYKIQMYKEYFMHAQEIVIYYLIINCIMYAIPNLTYYIKYIFIVNI